MLNNLKKIFSWKKVKFILLPFGVLVDGLKVPGRTFGKKIIVVLASLVIGFYWWGSVKAIYVSARTASFSLGIFHENIKVPVSGTSMLPTIQDGTTVELSSVGRHNFLRGDIVSFNNTQTNGLNYLKRIVGLPGEDIVVKNGLVFINGKPLSEDYINLNTGTYGNTFLLECRSNKVPEDSYAVMGDNRTVSWDSRAIGFVKQEDIKGYLNPVSRPQIIENISGHIPDSYKVNAAKVLSLINAKRQENKVVNLLPSTLLTDIAQKRSLEVSNNLDNWKTNSFPVDKILDDSGYRYNLTYEFVTFGYLDEEGIVNQILENPDAKNAILSGKFLESGIGFTEVTDGDCKYPLISLILTWPSNPTYGKDTIDWWQNEVKVTNEILTSLQGWVGYSQKDQAKLKESINLTAQMNVTSTRILKKMKNKEWLDQTDYAESNNYQGMITKNNQLLDELFPKVKGINTNSSKPELF